MYGGVSFPEEGRPQWATRTDWLGGQNHQLPKYRLERQLWRWQFSLSRFSEEWHKYSPVQDILLENGTIDLANVPSAK